MTAGPHAGALAGRYQLGDLLGTGGLAAVYRGRDLLLQRDVAVKVFGPGIDPNALERERVEMRTLAGLSHPNLVTVHDAGVDDQHAPPRAFLVMTVVDGPSLADCLQSGPLPPDRVRRLAADVLAALAYVHSRDVVHRDVKPGNILLDQAGTAYLADFGIARTVGAHALTATGDVIGTVAFLSPEQVLGQPVGPPADVYACGLVLLEALTGGREYVGTTAEAALARLSRPPQVAGRVPTDWEELLSAMTATDAPARPTAAQALAVIGQSRPSAEGTEVLRQPPRPVDATKVLTGTAATPAAPVLRPPTIRPRPPRQRRVSARSLALGAAALLAVVLVVTAVSGGGDTASTRHPAPPAGSPGPDRLGPDVNRLRQLVSS